MSFTTISFLVLWLAALGWRITVGRSGRGRLYEVGLLALSLTFYAWHVPAYLGLILFSISVDYLAGRATGEKRRLLMPAAR